MQQAIYEEHKYPVDNAPCKFHKTVRSMYMYGHPNWHDNLELKLCLEGEGYIILNGEKCIIKKDDIAVINSNVIHDITSDTYAEFRCLVIMSDFCKSATIDHTQFVFEPLFQSKVIRDLMLEIGTIYKNKDNICRIPMLQTAVLQILIELRQHHTISQSNTIQNPNSFEGVKQTIKYVRENYPQKISLDLLAQNAAVDKYSLSKNFKVLTGQTIVQYINNYRCKKAIEFIMDGIPINEAAILCGFNNMSFFTKTFKSYLGKKPSDYKPSSR